MSVCEARLAAQRCCLELLSLPTLSKFNVGKHVESSHVQVGHAL